ncbi:glutathione S-transferase family protein [soil metagenome]
MVLALYAHPFSSYCWKAIIALYENGTAFSFNAVDLGNAASAAELERLWPLRKFPVLRDNEKTVIESTIIIEYLDLYHPGQSRLVPIDPKTALDARFADRFFDNYIQTPMQAIVSSALRGGPRDAEVVLNARTNLETGYAWLEHRIDGREWVTGNQFSMADCSAAPALFYADWSHAISDAYPNVRAYGDRLNARPSVARTIDEARPYRHFFPLGAPDRD